MKMTLKRLKEDAKSGKLSLEMVERNGSTKDIPNKLKGVRPVVDANTVSITLLNADGKKSALEIGRAALCECQQAHA